MIIVTVLVDRTVGNLFRVALVMTVVIVHVPNLIVPTDTDHLIVLGQTIHLIDQVRIMMMIR